MNADLEYSYELLREKIIIFMINRGWKDKIAKRRGFEQSLLEHSANCLDVMLILLPALKSRLQLTIEEEQALILGIAIHDVAKERSEWQAYIRGEGMYEPHIVPEYTIAAVEALAEWLEFGGQADARAGANLHMKSVQTVARIFTESQTAGPRMVLLQRLIADVDNVASANGLLSAHDALVRSSLDKYIHVAYHIVHVRGISTTMLHQAAQMAFEKQGWKPLLFYPTGTLYVRPGYEEPTSITAEMVQIELLSIISQVLLEKRKILPELAVGDIRFTFFPKPDLFDHHFFKDYLRVASTRASVKSGKKINPANAQTYLNISALLKVGMHPALVIKTQGKTGNKLLAQVDAKYHNLLVKQLADIPENKLPEILNRIGKAHPEMAIFKFMKDFIKSGLLDETGNTAIRQAYNDLFGPIAYEALMSTSNIMPARDQAFTVDFFWALSLKKLAEFLQSPELDIEDIVGAIEQKRRVGLLIEALNKIGEIGFAAMEQPPTIDNFARKMAEVFIGDLVVPEAVLTDVRKFAEKQLRYYEKAKQNIRTERQVEHICPACNQPFKKGTEALVDFVGGTSYTGRRLAYDGEGLVICLACYYERLLRQIILGRKAYDLIVLMPRMSIGRYGGRVFLDNLGQINRLVKGITTADTTNPDETLRLDMTWFIARKALAANFNHMSIEDLVRLFTYHAQNKTVEENLKKVIKQIQETLGSNNLEVAKDWWQHDFVDWMEAARAVAYKKVDDDVAQIIRERVYGLRPPIKFVAQTPNIILAPSSNPRVSNYSALVDSDADSDCKCALKQLLITLAFALGLDCSVAILHDDESLDEPILETGGVAYVPPLSTVRDLIIRGRSIEDIQKLSPAWVSQSEAIRWLRALASAVLLANKTQYPPRNDLYQILTIRSKGALLRRIELKQKKGEMISYENLQQLEAIGEVLR